MDRQLARHARTDATKKERYKTIHPHEHIHTHIPVFYTYYTYTYVYIYIRTNIHTYIRTYSHTNTCIQYFYICTYMHTYRLINRHTFVHTLWLVWWHITTLFSDGTDDSSCLVDSSFCQSIRLAKLYAQMYAVHRTVLLCCTWRWKRRHTSCML